MRLPAFNDAVRRMLNDAGWVPGRCIDTADAHAAHRARNLPFFAAAQHFIATFGGLTLPSAANEAALSLSPVLTLTQLTDDRLHALQAWLGEPFSVLGATPTTEKLLLVSERGAYYSASEHVLVAYGVELAEVFSRLCTHAKPSARHLN